jgi:hypothetical protein
MVCTMCVCCKIIPDGDLQVTSELQGQPNTARDRTGHSLLKTAHTYTQEPYAAQGVFVNTVSHNPEFLKRCVAWCPCWRARYV